MYTKFTQADIDNNQVSFNLHQSTYSDFKDEIKFIVNTSKCEEMNGTLLIIYEVDQKLKERTTGQNQEYIQVVEGGRSTISRLNFPITLHDFPFLYFNISNVPKHGNICKYTHRFHEENINMFTLSNLNSGEIQYCHDDSESKDDEFVVLIYSKNELDFQYVAYIKIDIKLKNDNEPFMSSSKQLLVVRGATKLITKDILTYSDSDKDTIANQIIYKNVEASNGWIYLNRRTTNEFSQLDINLKLVYFKHNEKLADIGNITFLVFDGLHEVNGFIVTKANFSFVTLKETDLLVKEGSTCKLDENVIDLYINFDVDPNYILYEV